MTRKEKLFDRLKSKPKDFTIDETTALLEFLGYRLSNKGKTSGSRICYLHKNHGAILLHRPHPSNILKAYQVKQLIEKLEDEGLL